MDSALLDYLPPPLLVALNEYVLRDGAPLQTVHAYSRFVASQVSSVVSPTTDRIYTMAAPLLDRVAAAAYNAPDVVVLLFVVVLIVLALQVLSLVRRILAWWTRMVFRLVFWAGMAALAAAVWQRGLEQSAQDGAAIVGRLYGYASFVGDIWRAEYNKYQQQQVQAQALNGGSGAYGGATHSYQQRGWGR